MRILHFIHSIDPATGGPVEGLRQRCTIYRMNGHEVELATLDSPESVARWDFPAKVVGLGPGWGVYGYSRRAMPWLKANLSRFDVVFVDGIWQYNLYAAHRALAGTKIPWAIFTHGMLDPYFKKRYPLKHIKKSIYWHASWGRSCAMHSAVLFTCEEEKILARLSFSPYRVRETSRTLWHIRPELRPGSSQRGVPGAMARSARQAAGTCPGANPSQEGDRHTDRGICPDAGQRCGVAVGDRGPRPDRMADGT